MTIGLLPDQQVSLVTRTAPEIRDTADRPGSILVLPIGSVEQHGDHLPVVTDSALATAVAAAGATRLASDDPILIAPPIWSGYSPHHLPFGGTITAEFDTLLALLEQVADSALENGFDAILLLNGHGGNKSLVSSAVSTIGTDHPDCEVLGLTYFDLAESFIDDIRESETGGMAHGGEFETSLMLHLHPGLVREDRMEATHWDEHYDLGGQDLLDGGALSVYRSFDEYSNTGAIGAPELASAEKGERILERLADELAALLEEIHAKNK
ncbi:creatininase family protein [Haladaptatus pallidirubidus]|nr:creatininase family protein [Haladaptatus pallidirubidus]